MKKLIWLLIILFIVIAFCICGCESKKQIDKKRFRDVRDSLVISDLTIITNTAPKKKYVDSVIRQDISYDYEKHKFLLTTISVANLGGLKETATLFALRSYNTRVCYDKTISGSFNYIKNNKKSQLRLAQRYLHNHYVREAKKKVVEKLIQDSIQLLK